MVQAFLIKSLRPSTSQLSAEGTAAIGEALQSFGKV